MATKCNRNRGKEIVDFKEREIFIFRYFNIREIKSVLGQHGNKQDQVGQRGNLFQEFFKGGKKRGDTQG